MRKPILAMALLLVFLPLAQANAADGLETVESRYDMETTIERLHGALEEAGMNVFTEVDHAAGAENAGMRLQPTHVVMFGNPEVGTRLMQCGRSAAIDLPMKALIWEDEDGVHVGYNSADYLAARHGLDTCDEVIQQVGKALARFAGHAAGRQSD